jgi:Transposase DDE domain
MRPPYSTLTPTHLYDSAATLIESYLQWHDYGPKCTVKALLQIRFYAAGHLCSVFAACSRLRTAPSDQAVRDALAALCPEPTPLEQRLDRLFAAQLPKGLRKRSQRVAIDLTWVPYHGQPHQRPTEIYRGQAKSGTTHFHAYATAYIVRRGQRFTVALIRVESGTALVEVLKRLLHLARQAGIRPRLLLLDRGFYRVVVIRYLYRARYPFVMPVVRRGRRTDDPRGPSGINVLAATKRSGWRSYTLTNADKQTATVPICVHCRNWQGRRGRHGRHTLVYACWGIGTRSTAWVYQTYRLRFGIETSYRQLNEARIKTTTRDPALRLLFVAIALILRNAWVWVHQQLLATPRRGGRTLNLGMLPFKMLLLWLTYLAMQTFGIVNSSSCAEAHHRR